MKSNKLDQFYTSKLVVNEFLSILKSKKIINENSILIEPSAGDGKFLDGFETFFPKNIYEAYDIEKNHPNVLEQDFLQIQKAHNSRYVVIGNPPFGYKSKMAINFINKSSEFSDIVCFVLPIQFRRWSVQKQINKDFKLIYSSENLPRNSFLVKNKPYNVNCLLQIWVNKKNVKFDKYKDLRIYEKPKNKHEDFKLWIHNNTNETLKYFDKDKYKWDFAVVRQGYYDYKEKIINPLNLIQNRQYLFVKYINEQSKLIFEKIDFEKLSNSNTSVKGFSNTDLVAEYEQIKNNFLDIKD